MYSYMQSFYLVSLYIGTPHRKTLQTKVLDFNIVYNEESLFYKIYKISISYKVGLE
jgi:hypothetical protein